MRIEEAVRERDGGGEDENGKMLALKTEEEPMRRNPGGPWKGSRLHPEASRTSAAL